MGILTYLAIALRAFMRRLGLIAAETPSAPRLRTQSQPIAFGTDIVIRKREPSFHLAGRLSAIARLNTPIGRKPHVASRRADYLPAIPVERLGAKKLRLDANQGNRVLRHKPADTLPTPRKSAEILPFPLRPVAAAGSRPRLLKAA